jgi:hypothetical protein
VVVELVLLCGLEVLGELDVLGEVGDGEQYRNGVVTFINVLTATPTELSARDQVEQSAQAGSGSRVVLQGASEVDGTIRAQWRLDRRC